MIPNLKELLSKRDNFVDLKISLYTGLFALFASTLNKRGFYL